MDPFKPAPVVPIGIRQTLAFVDYTPEARARGMRNGLQPIGVPEYPPHPRGRALRDLRVDLGLGLRQATAMLGLTAVELSALERGASTLEPAAEWDRAEAVLRAGAAEIDTAYTRTKLLAAIKTPKPGGRR